MGLKNINVFEQHVEKIVLAVAGAGAVFMGCLAMQTIALPDHPDIGPRKVEEAVGREVDAMDALRQERERAGKPTVQIPDFVGDYNRIANGQPLELKDYAGLPGATSATPTMPEFGPHNLQPRHIGLQNVNTYKSVIPDAPLPEIVRAEAMQPFVFAGSTIDASTGQPIVLGPNTQFPTTTKNVVVIDGYIPVGKMVLQMLGEKDLKRFTVDVQRGLVYRIRVFRRELLPSGAYSQPEPVVPARGFAQPPDTLTTALPEGSLQSVLPDIDAQFQAIQLPSFYVDNLGQPIPPPILARPIPKAIAEEMKKLDADIQSASQASSGLISRPPVMPVAPVVPGGPATFPNAMDQIRPLSVQPFTFWDESVQADHTYRYSVKVELVNPGFGWKWGLDKPGMKLEPVIPVKNDGMVDIPGTIVVHSDMAFFVNSGDNNLGRISGIIFKQKNGRWYQTAFNADKGTTVIGQMNIDGKSEEVDTNFALVDIQADPKPRVILKDPTGNLVVRDIAEDWNRQERGVLQEKVKQGAAEAATRAAIDPVTGQPVTPVVMTPIPAPTPVTPARGPATTPAAPPRVPVRP